MAIQELLLLGKARAKKKKKAQEKASLEAQIRSLIPTPEKGRDGRDAPGMDEILQNIKSLLPETKIVEHKTVQQVKEEISDEKVRKLIREELPEPTLPEIRIIEKEVEMDTSGFVTKKDLEKVLRRIDQAIQNNRGGGGMAQTLFDQLQLVNCIETSTDRTFSINEFDKKKLNIIHCTQPNITVRLPKIDPSYAVWVQQAYDVEGSITILKEA